MVRKGVISSVDTTRRRARVMFRDLDNTVTAEIPYADHVAPEVNDTAAVVFFSRQAANGVIIAVYKEG